MVFLVEEMRGFDGVETGIGKTTNVIRVVHRHNTRTLVNFMSLFSPLLEMVVSFPGDNRSLLVTMGMTDTNWFGPV